MRNRQSGIAREFVIVGLFLSLAILFLLGTFVFGRPQEIGTGDKFSPKDGPALITNSTTLYNQMGDADRFKALAIDLSYFARTALNTYKEGRYNDITFTVDSDSVLDGETIAFSGSFGEEKGTVDVVVTLKNYGKITSDIRKNAVEINAQLPSNSKRNQLIGILPITQELYAIDYLESLDKFSIQMYSKQKSDQNKALNQLESSLGVALKKDQYSLTVPISDL